MKYCIATLLLLLTSFTSGTAGDKPVVELNKHVTYSVILKEKSVKAGTKGNLLIGLQPQKGIHINLKPPITIIIDSTNGILRSGPANIPKADSFLNTSKPIIQQIAFPAGLKKGKGVITGTVTYFYCSDAEGWCSRFVQPFMVRVNVVR